MPMISGRILVRNAVLNLLGHGWLLVLGFVTAPVLLHRLGTDAYGVLAITAIVTGYVGVLDLGIGRAAVKFLSERLARGAYADAGRIVSTAIGAQVLLGLVGAALLWLSAPALAERVLRVAPELSNQALFALRAMALGLPFVMVGGVLEGVPMALQRFELTATIRAAAGTLKAALAIGLVLAGFGVRGAVVAAIAVQAVQLAIMWAIIPRLLPDRTAPFRIDPTELKALLRFGGWVTVSSLIGPILVYADRFLVGALSSIQAVSYYSIPYDAVTRLWIIPYAIVPVLFPAFAALRAENERHQQSADLYLRAVRYTFLVMAPMVTLVVTYAPQFLRAWVGEEIAIHGALAMRVLALGVFVNSLAQIPFGLIQASGRPDITAKFHIAETPIYLLLCVWLIPRWGVAGAAAAWSLRVLIDAALLTASAARMVDAPVAMMLRRALAPGLMLAGGLALGTAIIRALGTDAGVEFVLMSLVLGAYLTGIWGLILTPGDRKQVAALADRFRAADRVPTLP